MAAPELLPILKAIEGLGLSVALRGSAWAYPVLECIHLLGLAVVFGTLVVLDLRVLVHRRSLKIDALGRFVLPLTLAGFVVAFLSGLFMFITRATEFGYSLPFRVKLLLILLAGINAFVFHLRGGLLRRDAGAMAQAVVSLGLWACVVVAGRWIAYA